MHISVQHQDFDFVQVEQYFRKQNTKAHIGAIVTFTGLVREFQHLESEDTQVLAIEIEHYPSMTLQALTDIAHSATSKWSLNDVMIIHRVGRLKASDNIVLVATASAHRSDAFQACQYIMDILKTSAPFWKKEITDSGERWVEAKDSDTQAALCWQNQPTVE